MNTKAKDSPKISIITVVFNSENSILSTLKSVRNQSYKNIEHIVVDGLSSDNTCKIVEDFGVEKLISEKDTGIYNAINKGISVATGDIVGLLHSEDYFESKNTISEIVQCFKNEEKCNYLYGNLKYFRGNKTIRVWESKRFNQKDVKLGWMMPHTTLFCKKEIFESLGTYNEEYQISADYDFILRLVNSDFKPFFFDEFITEMSIGGKSTKNLRNLYMKSMEDLKIIKNNLSSNIFVSFIILILKNLRKVHQFYRNK